MVFKTRKIPAHLIIEDDYVFREKRQRGLVYKLIFWGVMLTIVYFVGFALLQVL